MQEVYVWLRLLKINFAHVAVEVLNFVYLMLRIENGGGVKLVINTLRY